MQLKSKLGLSYICTPPTYCVKQGARLLHRKNGRESNSLKYTGKNATIYICNTSGRVLTMHWNGTFDRLKANLHFSAVYPFHPATSSRANWTWLSILLLVWLPCPINWQLLLSHRSYNSFALDYKHTSKYSHPLWLFIHCTYGPFVKSRLYEVPSQFG